MSKSKGTTYLAVTLVVVGFIVMALGWNGAASYDTPEQQFPYLLSASFPGLGLVAAGLVLALVQELRRVTAAILGRLDTLASQTPTATATPLAPTAVPAEGESRVVAAGSSYHRPDCTLVEGRTDLQAMSVAAAAERDLTACRVCEPAEADAA